MTVLTRNIRRKTASIHQGREIVIDAGARTLRLREKGRREWVAITWEAALHLAYKIKAREARAEKLAKKKKVAA